MMRNRTTLAAVCLVIGWIAPAAPARADISRALGESTSMLLQHLERHTRPGQERYLVMNGEVVRARLGQTPLRPRELNDRLEAQALGILDNLPPIDPNTPEGRRAEVGRALKTPVRFDADGWGAFVQLFGGHPGELGGVLQHLAYSGRLGPEAAGGFVSIATRDQKSRVTDVWVLDLDAEFSPFGFVGMAPGDVDGDDYPGVGRYPGSTRTMTLSEYSVTGDVHVVAYSGSGTPAAHAAHYRRAFVGLGMVEAPSSRNATQEQLLRFSDGNRNAAVFVQRSDSGDRTVLDVIQVSVKDPDK